MTSVYIEKEWSSSKNLQIVKAGDGVEKRELSYTIGENVNWYNHYGEQCGGSIKKKQTLKIKIPYDSAIPHQSMYPEKNMMQKDTHTLMFIEALFLIAKMRVQHKYPLTNEWIKKT